MSVIQIRATIECEGCGTEFSVEIDTASNLPDGWDLCDLAKDAVRGSVGYEHRLKSSGCSSVQDDKMLCGSCTDLADKNYQQARADEGNGGE